MNIAVVLAGQYRGDNEMIRLHKQNVGDYDTYVSCLDKYVDEWKYSEWNQKEIYRVPMVDYKDTLWGKHRNDEPGESGFWQFWNLKWVLQNVPQYDFYIKSRNDLVIESPLSIDFNTLRDDTYYYSERTFNGIWGHINDQFWIGSSQITSLISKFVDEFYCKDGSVDIPHANEHMLRWWIEQNGYKIEKFPNFYYTKNHNGITQCSGEINKFFLEYER